MAILFACLRLPAIGWRLGRAGVLGHIARVDLIPSWMQRLLRFLNWMIAGRSAKQDAGQALCIALQNLGPAFIKFGQALSTRSDLLGPDIASGLVRLQDKLPAFSQAKVLEIIKQETGQDADSFFASFDPVPVAAASVAQVHRATLPDGREVAVKLLRPGIQKRMQRDIRFFYAMARLVEFLAPDLRRLKLVHAVEQFRQLSDSELDLRMEAAAGNKLAENLKDDDGIRVPQIDVEHATANMLIIEWIAGLRIDDREGLIAAGHDISVLTERAAQSFFMQVFRDGYFHADMHPGNIFVTEDGTLVPIDFGIMGHLQINDRIFLAELLVALIDRDYDQVAQLHSDAGMLAEDVPLELFSQSLRAMVDPVLGKTLGDIELGRALGQILQISARFEITIQPQFNLLQKTMGMAEGVARELNPDANMWVLARPLAADWIKGQTGLRLQLEQFFTDITRLRRGLPRILEKFERELHEKPHIIPPKKSNYPLIITVIATIIAITAYIH